MINRSSVRWLAAVSGVLCLLSMVTLAGCSSGEEAPAPTTTTTAAAPVTTTTTATTQQGKLEASDVIVRSGPGLTYDAVGGLAEGEEFTIVGREGDWYRIQFGDGYGYVSAQYVDVEGQPNKSEMVADRTTVATQATTSRTKPQSQTTKPAVNGTTAKDTATTIKSNGSPAMEGIPDTGIIDEF